MKNTQRGFIVPLLLIIIAILLAGGGAYIYTQKNTSESPSVAGNVTLPQATSTTPTANQTAPVAQTSDSQPTNLETYTNSTYGFSFQYPKTATLFGTSDYGSKKTFASNPVAYVRLDDNSETEGYMTISISSNPSEIAKCTSPGAFVSLNNSSDIPAQYREVLAGNAKNTTINGVTFLQYDVTSHDEYVGSERQYTAVRNGLCIDIRLATFPSGCVSSGCDNRQWSVQTETALLNLLDVIAQSVKFK